MEYDLDPLRQQIADSCRLARPTLAAKSGLEAEYDLEAMTKTCS